MTKALLFPSPSVPRCIMLSALLVSCSNADGEGGEIGLSPTASSSSTSGGPTGTSNNSTSTQGGDSSSNGTTGGIGPNASGTGGSGGSSTAPAGTGSGASTQTGASGTASSTGSGAASSGATGVGTSHADSSSSAPADSDTDSSNSSGNDSSDTGGMPMNNAPVPSAGCEQADGLTALTTGGMSVAGGLPTSTRLRVNDREYILDVPADYDPTRPYRLIFSWHQAYGSSNGNAVGQYPANNGDNFNAQNYAFFGLHREARLANDPVIFVAPQGIGDFPWDYDRDVALFDDLLELVGASLCIDESRVFTTGFSFGAMMSHALSLGRQEKLRAAVTMAPANFNFTQPPNSGAPFAYMGVTGMSDNTCPWIRNGNSTTEGGKFCVLDHAKNNGCTTTKEIPIAMGGSKNHVCYDFEGCKAGYPAKVCTFDGNHTPSAIADGMSGGDDGLSAFVPPLAWDFISQF